MASKAEMKLAEELGYSDELAAAENKGAKVDVVCRSYLRLLDSQDAAKAKLKEVTLKVDLVKDELMRVMRVSKVQSLRMASGILISNGIRKFFSIPPAAEPDKREKCFRWLRRIRCGDIIQDSINKNTLNALLNERLAEKLNVPAELFTKYEQPTLSVTGRKKGKVKA